MAFSRGADKLNVAYPENKILFSLEEEQSPAMVPQGWTSKHHVKETRHKRSYIV